jgi:hypothetical protein
VCNPHRRTPHHGVLLDDLQRQICTRDQVFQKWPEAGHEFLARRQGLVNIPSTSAANRSGHGSNAPGRRPAQECAVYAGSSRRLLRHVATHHDFKPLPSFPGFVYHHARFSSDHKSVEIAVRPRKGSAAV